MSGLRLAWNAEAGSADLVLAGGQLDDTMTLASLVVVSLFSDRRAAAGDRLPPGDDDPRGWWGDTWLQQDHAGDLIGSRLWLLERAKSDPGLPLRTRDYILEALQWMIVDGVASAIEAQCEFAAGDQPRLNALVTISRQAQPPITLEFAGLWQELPSA